MNWTMFNNFIWCLSVMSAGVAASGCNTTKATVDTTVQFFSSTSPNSMFTADGMVVQQEKINLFAGVAFENLRQEAARGEGQYLTSLATLMNIPPGRHEEFGQFLQRRHSILFASDLAEDRSAHLKFVATLDRELQARDR